MNESLQHFDAHACAVDELDDLNTFLIALADRAEMPETWIELQRALEHDEQDVALGMDTYCVVLATGATHYGGITSCVLTQDALHIAFSAVAQAELGVAGYHIHLAITEADKTRLRNGLMRLFADAPQRPAHVVLPHDGETDASA